MDCSEQRAVTLSFPDRIAETVYRSLVPDGDLLAAFLDLRDIAIDAWVEDDSQVVHRTAVPPRKIQPLWVSGVSIGSGSAPTAIQFIGLFSHL